MIVFSIYSNGVHELAQSQSRISGIFTNYIANNSKTEYLAKTLTGMLILMTDFPAIKFAPIFLITKRAIFFYSNNNWVFLLFSDQVSFAMLYNFPYNA